MSKDSRVDRHTKNQSLIFAIEKRNLPIVKELLSDPEVEPNWLNNLPLIRACENGETEMVKLLLSYPRYVKIYRNELIF